jgi:hypothetical protein
LSSGNQVSSGRLDVGQRKIVSLVKTAARASTILLQSQIEEP